MNVNIVTVKSGWILQKIAERLSSHNKEEDVHLKVGHDPDSSADVNYYVDIQNCYFGNKTKCDIGYFTHSHEDSVSWLAQLIKEKSIIGLDGITSMAQRYTDMLIRLGYPQNKIITLVPGETKGMFPLKKTVLGIASRGGFPGYGQFFMEELLSKYDFSNFRLKFIGNGWENLAPIAQDKRISMQLKGDADYSIYPKFYHTIDYLLIPTLWTAGPMSMQEALSCGVPVIASDVGFVGYEFQADYTYPPGDLNSLIDILDKIQKPKLDRRRQIEHMSWSKFTSQFVKFAKEISQI